MPAVTIREQKVWVDQTAIPLLSGEVHYWRLDPNSWRAVLRPVHEMGIQTVATYVCWDFHQVAPGQYDFTGETDPRRNLIRFLDLLTEEGFWIIIRPGPYIYSEWKNNGVPDEAAKYHRLSPEFKALAEPYMAAVTEAIRPHLASNGGRIILWQADNEIDPWPHLYTEALGLGRQVGLFHTYLRERYGTVECLNDAWQTGYTDIDQARAVSEMFREDPRLMGRYNDFRSFLHWYVNQVAAWAVGVYRQLGVDVPIILNAYSGVSTQLWADLEQIADLVGSDIYPSREYLYRPGEQRHVIEALRYARTFSKAPYVAEFEAGIWHDWLGDVGTLTGNHYRLICLSALLGGAVGWNWYMLVNRDNWYQSPINEWGRTRPELFNAFKQITALVDRLDPSTLEKITETAVTFDPLQRGTQRPGQDMLASFHDADIDYEFFDLNGRMTDKPVAFYAGGQWLSSQGQQQLVHYVENGGHLVCIGSTPTLDEHLQPLNLLDIREPEGIVGVQGKVTLRLFDEYTVESPWLHNYDATPGEPVIAERLAYRQQPSEELALQFSLQEGLRYSVGYQVGRGQGRITVIGLQPSPTLLIALHQHFGVSIPCRSQTGSVTSTLYQRDGNYYVIATNDGTESKAAVLSLPGLSGPWQVEDLMSGQTSRADLSAGDLTTQLERKDGIVLRLSPSETG